METSIEELICTGETETIEFKESANCKKEILTSLVAFLNNDRGEGFVLLGITDQGIPIGLVGNFDKLQKTLRQFIDQYLCPQNGFSLSINVKTIQNKKIIVLYVSRLNNWGKFHYGGNFYIRKGTENVKVHEVALNQKIDKRKMNRYTALEMDILKELYNQEQGRGIFPQRASELQNILEDGLIQQSFKKFGNSLNLHMTEYFIPEERRIDVEKLII